MCILYLYRLTFDAATDVTVSCKEKKEKELMTLVYRRIIITSLQLYNRASVGYKRAKNKIKRRERVLEREEKRTEKEKSRGIGVSSAI